MHTRGQIDLRREAGGARIRNLDEIQVAYARLRAPIPFDSADGKPVSDILVLLVPKQATDDVKFILTCCP